MNQKGNINLAIVGIIIVIVGVIGYLLLAQKSAPVAVQPTPTATPKATPTPSLTPTPTPDVTAGWQTYNNEKYSFELKYPDTYKIAIEPQLDQFKESIGASYLMYLKHSSTDASIYAISTNITFDLQSIKQRFAPTGNSDAPIKTIAGNKTFYFYGPGGGGVSYPDLYFYDLKGKVMIIYFDGPYVNDKTPSQETKILEPQILSTFKFIEPKARIKIEPDARKTIFTIKNNNIEVDKIKTDYPSDVTIFRQMDNNVYLGVQASGLGGYILYGGPNTLYKLDLATNVLSKIAIVLKEGFFTDISPDQTKVAYVTITSVNGNEGVVIENIAGGSKKSFSAPVKYKVLGDALFSPDGKKIAYAAAVGKPDSEAGAVFIVDIATGEQTTLKTKTGGAFEIVKWLDNDTVDYK